MPYRVTNKVRRQRERCGDKPSFVFVDVLYHFETSGYAAGFTGCTAITWHDDKDRTESARAPGSVLLFVLWSATRAMARRAGYNYREV